MNQNKFPKNLFADADGVRFRVNFAFPLHLSSKEKNRFYKTLEARVRQKFNKDVLPLGVWPLTIKRLSHKSSEILVLQFGKALESGETAQSVIEKVCTFLRDDLELNIFFDEK